MGFSSPKMPAVPKTPAAPTIIDSVENDAILNSRRAERERLSRAVNSSTSILSWNGQGGQQNKQLLGQ